jgi:cation:H+ antiporter
MWLAILAIVAGLVLLVWSADRFVDGAASVASKLGMSQMMIGLTIVALGTSAPELFVSANAALAGASGLAVGNAIGSNLANIGMVLGITALIAPIPIAKHLLWREVPFLLFVTALGAYCVYDGDLDRVDGLLLFSALAFLFYRLLYSKSHSEHPEEEADLEHIPHMEKSKAWISLIVGLVVLIASSDMLVWGAKEVALSMGISELVIGLSIVAVGTSLPELAASVTSALRGHHDIALGNILGSNMLNILGVMATAAVISPTALEHTVFSRDYLSMGAMTLALAFMLYGFVFLGKKAKPTLGRLSGIILLAAYGAYYVWLFAGHQ